MGGKGQVQQLKRPRGTDPQGKQGEEVGKKHIDIPIDVKLKINSVPKIVHNLASGRRD